MSGSPDVAGGWLFVAEVEVSVMGLAEDHCRISLRRGGEADVLRLQHAEVGQLDRDIPVPACPGSDQEAALSALKHAASAGALRMLTPTRPELLGRDQVQEAVARGTERWAAEREGVTDASWEAERTRPSRIVQTAGDLRLVPEPTGVATSSWRARCPGTNHSLMISRAAEQFGCGYCRVRGGPEELRALAGQRQAGGRRRRQRPVEA